MRRRLSHLAALTLTTLALQACGASAPDAPPPGPVDADASAPRDAGSSDAGATGTPDARPDHDAYDAYEEHADAPDPVAVTVAIDSPAGPVATNGTLDVALSVTGEPLSVDLFASFGQRELTIAEDLAYPYTFSWDTTDLPEGTYELLARADDDLLEPGQGRLVRVDRTAPFVATQTPAAGSDRAASSLPITLVFDDALDRDSVTPDAATLTIGGRVRCAETTLDDDDRTLRVGSSPRCDPLLPAAFDEVTVSLPSSLRDRAGNSSLAYTTSWSYPAFGELGSVALTSTKNASISSSAFEGGAAVAVSDCVQIQSRVCVDHDLRVFSYVDGALAPLGDAASLHPGRRILSHDITTDDDGGLTVAYSVDTSSSVTSSSSGDVYLSAWSPGTGWAHSSAPLDSDPTLDAHSPTLLFDDGELFVAWIEAEDSPLGRVARVHVSASGAGLATGASPWALSGASGPLDSVSMSRHLGRLVLGSSLADTLQFVTHDGSGWTPLPNLPRIPGARLVGITDGAALVYEHATNLARLILLDASPDAWTLPDTEPVALTPTHVVSRDLSGGLVVHEGRPPAPLFGGAPFTKNPEDATAQLTRDGTLLLLALERTTPPTLRVLTPNTPRTTP